MIAVRVVTSMAQCIYICLFLRASLATGIRVVQSSVCRHSAIGMMWAYSVSRIFWQTGSFHKSNCIPKCTTHLRATAGANVRRRRVVGFWVFVVVTYSSSGTPPTLHALRLAPTQQQTWVRSCSHPDAWVHIVRRGVSGPYCHTGQSTCPFRFRHSTLRYSAFSYHNSYNGELSARIMDPRIIYPIFAGGSNPDVPFDDSSLYAPAADPRYSMLSSTHDVPDPAHFDTYIAGMVTKKRQHHHYPLPPTPTPTSSERSSMEDPRLDDSPSQATITQAAVRVESALRLKKKRSFGQALKAFKTPSLDFTESLRGRKRVPLPSHQEDSYEENIGADLHSHLTLSAGPREDEENSFEDRNRTVRRRNMPHHPFSPEDAPYMQAYSQILLENDYQTHRLLCKLARADTPTFHNFGKKPPSDVLDLGCGEGFWVLHAAKLWKSSNTRIVGLDLIDVHNNEAGEVHPHLEPEHAAKNVVWKRANFVKYPLPFPDNSFDLVRMANLTLCIPVSRWKFVLTQVRRVLRPGGRLELIDDDLFFPTILPRPTRDDPRSLSRPNYQRAANSENIVLGLSSPISRARSEKPLPKLPSFERSPNFKNGHARTSSEVDFSANSIIATHLETIFQNMLTNRYGIAPRPHTFLEHMLREVFGLSCAHQTHHFELAVPSRDLVEQCENFEPSPRPRVSSHAKRLSEDEKRGKGSPWTRTSPSSPVLASSPLSGTRSQRTSDEHPRVDPAMLHTATPKARQLLLGDGSSLDSRTPSWKEAGPYQPPGLVLLPATLIPCTPLELEMHACKHMNTLLGCKDALSKYVTAQKGRHGKPVVSERELDDYLWDYECFRRKRFNWPQDVPGLQLEDDFDESVAPSPPATKTIFKFSAGTPPQAKRTVSIDGLRAHVYGGAMASTASKEHSTHVRTIRVYEATKSMHPEECGYGDH